jgi:riboflavin synthase
MFTGLVETMGEVLDLRPRLPGVRLVIGQPHSEANVSVGDSIAVSGCCLTVVECDGHSMAFDAGEETLRRTTLGRLARGARVNLEWSLRIGNELGGHFVTGHIDGVGTLERRNDTADWSTFWFRVPSALARQMASKGSVAIDGVSLTLVDVEDDRFSVALIPHTLAVTTLGERQAGDDVNIETDILAKYVQRYLSAQARNH